MLKREVNVDIENYHKIHDIVIKAFSIDIDTHRALSVDI